MRPSYFKIAWRNLRKNKEYGFLNIGGLAIGIACFSLIFLWVEDELQWDHSNLKMDRLSAVRVNFNFGGATYTNWSTPRPLAAAMKADIPGIVNTCRISDGGERQLIQIGNRSLYAEGRYADSAIFSMFTLPFVQGNAESAFRQLYSLVITETTAKKFFGNDRNILGRTIRMGNRQDMVITGVLKDLPENATIRFEWLASYEFSIVQDESGGHGYNDVVNWGGYGPFTCVEVSPGTDIETINRQLFNYIHTKDPSPSQAANHAFLFPMSDWHLHDSFENGKQTTGGQIGQVHLLSLIAWIILLIACINFMNLATARSEKRAREVGVRKVLGAGKGSLISQFMGEALLFSIIAAVLAVGILYLALPAFNHLVIKQLSPGWTNPVHLVTLLVIAMICGVVAGSYPAFYLSSFQPVKVLKGLGIRTGSATFVRKGLVVFQFAISVIFIISTVIVYLQLKHIQARDLGFQRDHLLEVNVEHNVSRQLPIIRQDLLQTGVVDNVALTNNSVLGGGNRDDRFKWAGKDPNRTVNIAFRNISPSFIAASGMKIVEGRDYDPAPDSGNADVVINESLARIINSKGSAVGMILQSPRGEEEGHFKALRIRGVVSDYIFGNLYGQADPLVLFCEPPEWEYLLYVRVKAAADTRAAMAKIEQVLKKDNPVYPFEGNFIDDAFNNRFQEERQTSQLAGSFSLLAVIISCLGLFGLAAYTAERRKKEIGIRKLLGASVARITRLLSRDFVRLVLIACLIAFPLAWWIMHSWLQNYQYRITIHWWVFAITGLATVLITCLTIGFQSIRAAIANPARILRTE